MFWLFFSVFYAFRSSASGSKLRVSHPSRIETSSSSASSSQTEKEYLAERFAKLKAVNSETIGYVYAPGTQLDEPVVQTKDNETYLLKTFEGKQEPYMGAVFMDKDNHKDFSDRLTWLFGHARGSKAGDHRMFNDVNYYDRQDYFDKHRYVVIETPERKYYYQAMGTGHRAGKRLLFIGRSLRMTRTLRLSSEISMKLLGLRILRSRLRRVTGIWFSQPAVRKMTRFVPTFICGRFLIRNWKIF